MSTTKYFSSCILLMIVVLCNLTFLANGIPVAKQVLGSTRKAFRNDTRIHGAQKVATKPIIRKPRFFGKFSFMAGLGLPEAASSSITRNDIVLSDRRPAQYSVSYNFPPRKWGPYVAAVYEPLPIWSFFQDPWAYLASALNPFNWFTTHTNTNIDSTNLLVHTITPDKSHNDDLLVLVEEPDNEIPNEDHNTVIDKIELKMDKDHFNDARLQSTVNTEASVTITKKYEPIKNYVTVTNNVPSLGLIAEGTTIKAFEEIRMEDESDKIRIKANTRRTKSPHTVHTRTTSSTPVTTKAVSDSSTLSISDTTEKTTTAINFNNTLNTTNQTPLHSQNASSAGYNNGYYYHGYAQNITDIEFTTQQAPNTFVPIRYHTFDEINQFLQQYPTAYYDSFKPHAQERFDHFNHFEQKPPRANDDYSRNIDFLPKIGNNFLLNGFKPSFPFHL